MIPTIPSDIIRTVIKYLNYDQLYIFFIIYDINFDFKFNYDVHTLNVNYHIFTIFSNITLTKLILNSQEQINNNMVLKYCRTVRRIEIYVVEWFINNNNYLKLFKECKQLIFLKLSNPHVIELYDLHTLLPSLKYLHFLQELAFSWYSREVISRINKMTTLRSIEMYKAYCHGESPLNNLNTKNLYHLRMTFFTDYLEKIPINIKNMVTHVEIINDGLSERHTILPYFNDYHNMRSLIIRNKYGSIININNLLNCNKLERITFIAKCDFIEDIKEKLHIFLKCPKLKCITVGEFQTPGTRHQVPGQDNALS